MSVLNKSQIVANINSDLSDNSTGQISPYDIRRNLLDILDSIHILTSGSNILAGNLATLESGTVRVGSGNLVNIGTAGYTTENNTAVGFNALKSNYQGAKNTAVGADAVSCNIYGCENVGVGYTSLNGNTLGYGNVGLGNYSLKNNVIGNFNIAIGHAAGYYVDRDTNNKLFIASHPIDSGTVCYNPLGSGMQPLVYGDLSGIKFGIGVTSLHNSGTLQVSGDITPYRTAVYNLGNSGVQFYRAFLNSGIVFPTGEFGYINGKIVTSLDIIPSKTIAYNLGSTTNRWASGYFQDIYVTGNAVFNSTTTISSSKYKDKTLYLATSGDGGSLSGYLTDENLVGAGFTVKASGSNYFRDYSFVFLPSGSGGDITCWNSGDVYDKSSWNSNISLHLNSGVHLRTAKIIGYSGISLGLASGCYGLYIKDTNNVYFSKDNVLTPNPTFSTSPLAGVGNVNFYANSGESSDYSLSVSAIESGVSVSQRFLTGIKRRVKDALNSNKDKLQGFELKYIDDSSAGIVGQLTDRMVIGSYNDTSKMVNAITLMKGNNDGIFAVTNINPGAESVLPGTAFNVRSTGDAIARLTAENASNTRSSIELVGTNNCLQYGLELTYYNASGFAALNMYVNSGQKQMIRFNPSGYIGLVSNGATNATLTVGHSGVSGQYVPSISIYDTNVTSGNIVATSGYGKLYVTKVNRENINQSHALNFLDASGNTTELNINKYSTTDGRAVYSTTSNTFVGYACPSSRILYEADRTANTAVGSYALTGLASGDYNTVVGTNAGSGIGNGSYNVVVGALSANTVGSGTNNIVIGYSSFTNSNPYSHNNIVIGNSVANSYAGNYQFLLGNSTNILMSGTLGPLSSDKKLVLPSDGKLYLNNTTDSQSLSLRANYIDVIDSGGNNYPTNSLAFRFSGNYLNTLLTLNHTVSGMNNSETYYSPSPARPFAKLEGDLKLRGAIRFSDNTSLDSSSFLTTLNTLSAGFSVLQENFNNSIVEGYATADIAAPTLGSVPTTGSITKKNSLWNNTSTVTIVNRDTSLVINSGSYIIASLINSEYRPIWVSKTGIDCKCCN